MRGHECPFGQPPPDVHDDVVGEDDPDSQCEAGQPAIPAARDAQGQADDDEHQTGHRQGKPRVDLYDLVVGRHPLFPHADHQSLQLGDRHLA